MSTPRPGPSSATEVGDDRHGRGDRAARRDRSGRPRTRRRGLDHPAGRGGDRADRAAQSGLGRCSDDASRPGAHGCCGRPTATRGTRGVPPTDRAAGLQPPPRGWCPMAHGNNLGGSRRPPPTSRGPVRARRLPHRSAAAPPPSHTAPRPHSAVVARSSLRSSPTSGINARISIARPGSPRRGQTAASAAPCRG